MNPLHPGTNRIAKRNLLNSGTTRIAKIKPVLGLLVLMMLVVNSEAAAKDRDRRQSGVLVNPADTEESKSLPLTSSFKKECPEQPAIDNARVHCLDSTCRVLCNSGYKTPDGYGSASLACNPETGLLTYKSVPWKSTNLACNPYCGREGCENGGLCVLPGQCRCPSGYSGRYCQIAQATQQEDSIYGCPDPQIVLSQSSTANWTATELELECNPGYSFPIGGRVATIHCRQGKWDMPPGLLAPGGILMCQSDCNPPCQHYGTCIEDGLCDCPAGFWGPQCQIRRCTYPRRGLKNASLGGNLSRLKIECHEGYQMLSGRRSLTIRCRGGQWVIPKKGLMKDHDVKCYPEEQGKKK